MACTVPARTVRSTPSLATTPGNRLTMPRSSIAIGLDAASVMAVVLQRSAGCRARRPVPRSSSWPSLRLARDGDLAAGDLCLQILEGAGVLVDVLVADGVADAVVLQVVGLDLTRELAVQGVGDGLVGGHVHPLQGRR